MLWYVSVEMVLLRVLRVMRLTGEQLNKQQTHYAPHWSLSHESQPEARFVLIRAERII
jgi:hypothetical protein